MDVDQKKRNEKKACVLKLLDKYSRCVYRKRALFCFYTINFFRVYKTKYLTF